MNRIKGFNALHDQVFLIQKVKATLKRKLSLMSRKFFVLPISTHFKFPCLFVHSPDSRKILKFPDHFFHSPETGLLVDSTSLSPFLK